MVNICQDFVSMRNLKFGTNSNPEKSKTKCIVFSKKTVHAQPLNILLNNDQLPWVNQVNHLGHVLQCDNSMRIDIAKKRGVFIGKMNSLLQEFHFVTPNTLIKLMNIYATTLYGSNTWNIFSIDCEKLYTSFNVAVRQILNLNRCTHRYLIEPLSNTHHLKTIITSRYVTFFKTLVGSSKKPVRFLARLNSMDQRTVLGKTLSKIMTLTGSNVASPEDLTPNWIKKNLRYARVPDTDEWRIPLCYELLGARNGSIVVEGFTNVECEDILSNICIS